MARIKMVTRTVEYTVAEIMYCNTETADVSIRTEMFTGDFKNADELKKSILKTSSTEIPVKVTITGTQEKLFGMTETDFLKYATELPARSTKTE